MSNDEMDTANASFCADLARAADDPLFGTATGVQTWFLLEYRQPFRAKATTDNELPQGVKAFLAQQVAAVPNSRMLFVKQHKPSEEMLRFFIIRTDEISPEIFDLRIMSYDELMYYDLQGIAMGRKEGSRYKRGRPLFLVCTNGNRDKCCAKYGLPLYKQLQEIAGENVWQSSHIGGHRYAPNVLLLPHSVNYGLMLAEEVQQMVDAALRNEIFDLNRYRGRTYYTPVVQAADFILRQKLGLLDFSAVRLEGTVDLRPGSQEVSFRLPDGEKVSLQIEQQVTMEPQLVSCNSPKAKPFTRYRLLGYERSEPA